MLLPPGNALSARIAPEFTPEKPTRCKTIYSQEMIMMQENAAVTRVTQQKTSAVTVEEIAMLHKVRRILKPGSDVMLRLDSKGKTKVYRLTQETA